MAAFIFEPPSWAHMRRLRYREPIPDFSALLFDMTPWSLIHQSANGSPSFFHVKERIQRASDIQPMFYCGIPPDHSINHIGYKNAKSNATTIAWISATATLLGSSLNPLVAQCTLLQFSAFSSMILTDHIWLFTYFILGLSVTAVDYARLR